ncbi:hypothetical protein HDU83_002540 [Entophlyctis luteolus]|nr:hypothetical protein HDU83_002540 [Entophlyctis luteolus]
MPNNSNTNNKKSAGRTQHSQQQKQQQQLQHQDSTAPSVDVSVSVLQSSAFAESPEASDEIEALEAIYAGACAVHTIASSNAWRGVEPPHRSLVLTLSPQHPDLHSLVEITLTVLFGRKYPRQHFPPTLAVAAVRGVSESQVADLQALVTARAAQLAKQTQPQPYVYDLAEFLRESLDSHNSVVSDRKHTSVFEEMELRKLHSQNEQIERLRLQSEELRSADEDEDRALHEALENELRIKKEKTMLLRAEKRANKQLNMLQPPAIIPPFGGSSSSTSSINSVLNSFLSSPLLPVASSSETSFSSFSKGPKISIGPLGSPVYLALPFPASDSSSPPQLVIYSIPINNPYYVSAAGEGSAALNNIVYLAKRQSRLSHPCLQQIYDARLVTSGAGELFLEFLAESPALGMHSMDVLLKQVGVMAVSTAISYIRRILKGLAHMHSNNFVHKDVRCENFVFCGSADQIEVKLGGGEYFRTLLDLHETHPLSTNLRTETAFPNTWMAPETLLKHPVYGRKGDIWNLGRCFCHMLFGERLFKEQHGHRPGGSGGGARDFLEVNAQRMPPAIAQFLERVFDDDTVERPSAIDLLKDELFAEPDTDNALPLELIQAASIPLNSRPAAQAGAYPTFTSVSTPQAVIAAAVSTAPHGAGTEGLYFSSIGSGGVGMLATSRYHADFEQVDFLGKGGFGSVVKARNRIDNRFYAVKKIRVDSRRVGSGVKLLREVQTLSRLHHHHIVRYYQAWFEDAAEDELSDSDESDDFDGATTSSNSGSEYSTDSDDEEEDDVDDGLFARNSSTSDWHNHSPDIVFEDSAGGHDGTVSKRCDAQLHPGSSSGDDSRIRGDVRILFIQMEFCDNSTLSDLIRNGMEVSEAWRLFRQVVEGLGYLHNAGIIHRDLKPSNLFMDSLGNIKIGDFGLARKGTAPIQMPNSTTDLISSFLTDSKEDGTMTQDIGTPVYVAPELLQKGVAVKYNSKIDIYSLGIVFFEMLYHCTTGMQRGKVLMDLRLPQILFPSGLDSRLLSGADSNWADFDFKKLENAHNLLLLMLSHTPRERPTCQDLLESKYLPPKLEQDILSEALRSIVNPDNTTYYSRLMTTLFNQSVDKHKDLAYDLTSSEQSYLLNPNASAVSKDDSALRRTAYTLTRIHAKMLCIFQKHGAVELATPLLIPSGSFDGVDRSSRTSDSNKHPVKLLDTSGMVVQLPHDLTAPYARYLGRQKTVPILKRFVFDRVYRSSQVGGQPGSFVECSFDIASKSLNLMVPDAEVLLVALEVVESTCQYLPSEIQIFLNHGVILDACMEMLHVPQDLRISACNILERLDKPYTWAQTRSQLAKAGVLTKSGLDLLDAAYAVRGMDFEQGIQRLEGLLATHLVRATLDPVSAGAAAGGAASAAAGGLAASPGAAPGSAPSWPAALNSLKALVRNLANLGVKSKVFLVPLLSHNAGYYRTGPVFQVALVKGKRVDVFAAGGRYDSLVTTMRRPFYPRDGICAVGVNIAMSKLAFHANQNGVESQWSGVGLGSAIVPDLRDGGVSSLNSAHHRNAPVNGMGKARGVDVLIVSFGRGNVALDERLAILGEFWRAGIAAEILLDEGEVTTELLQTIARGYNLCVTVKSKDVKPAIIKVKNLVSKLEAEVSRSELLQHVINELGTGSEQSTKDESVPHGSLNKNIYETIAPTIFQPAWQKQKLKGKERARIQDRALSAVDEAVKVVSNAGNLFVVDLPDAVLRKLSSVDMGDEDAFRKTFEALPAQQREHLMAVRKSLLMLRKGGVGSGSGAGGGSGVGGAGAGAGAASGGSSNAARTAVWVVSQSMGSSNAHLVFV